MVLVGLVGWVVVVAVDLPLLDDLVLLPHLSALDVLDLVAKVARPVYPLADLDEEALHLWALVLLLWLFWLVHRGNFLLLLLLDHAPLLSLVRSIPQLSGHSRFLVRSLRLA